MTMLGRSRTFTALPQDSANFQSDNENWSVQQIKILPG